MSDTVEQELDADGIPVQHYISKVLIAVPAEGFGEQTLRYARSSLAGVHVGSVTAALDPDTPVRGRLQDEFLVDTGLADQVLDAYSGILIVGCTGEHPLARDAHIAELVRSADRDGKLIATWGNGLAVLIASGILRGRKVTGEPGLAGAARQAGARFTGREVQVDGSLITARDEGAGMRFGQALADHVRI